MLRFSKKHRISTSATNEEAIAGRVTGLMSNGEHVTWKARHFGVYQTLTSRITAFQPYEFFIDEMVEGAFKCFKHVHAFKSEGNKTVMTDDFYFDSPLGI